MSYNCYFAGATGWVNKLGGADSQGITRGGKMVLYKLIESTDLVPTCARAAGWQEISTKEKCCLPVLPYLGRVAPCPPAVFTLKLVNLVPFCVFLVIFEVLPLCWSLK